MADRSTAGDDRLLDAFVRSAQYIARLTTSQDVCEHLSKLAVRFYQADCAIFAHRSLAGRISLAHYTVREGLHVKIELTEHIEQTIADVMDNGFLASLLLLLPEPCQAVFLPVVKDVQTQSVLIVVHRTTSPISKELLNVYLALADLAGSIIERHKSERELDRHRNQLEQLVRERTADLEHANQQLIMEIQERRKIEEELKIAKKVADSANSAKSIFLANMSHEIRTPMNAILGFSQLMLHDAALTSEQRRHLDTINRSGEHLLALINDILEISKIEAGHAKLNSGTFDLHALVHDLEMMFHIRTDNKHLLFLVDYDAELPRYVVADEIKLRQIFINLLGNAVKFTERGGISWRLRSVIMPSGMSFLESEVEDTGPGIPAADLPRLFHSFEQSSARSGSAEGTGLGLALSRRFARLMGGDITVQSESGKGSCFFLRIGIMLSESGGLSPVRQQRRVKGLRPGQTCYRILVADDKRENRELMNEMLQTAGFQTYEATNGSEAISKFEQVKPHAILMDIRMPVMDGYEATRRIKATPEGRDTPIIMVTASAFDNDRERAMQTGADAYIRKPFKEEELFGALAGCLDVSFEYEDEEAGCQIRSRPGEALTAASCCELPEELAANVRDAIATADFEQLLESIRQAEQYLPEVAVQLRELAENFQYDTLLKLLPKRGTEDE